MELSLTYCLVCLRAFDLLISQLVDFIPCEAQNYCAQTVDQAMPYFDNALLLAAKTPDTGYPFFTNEPKLSALIGLKQIAAAQSLADEMLKESVRTNRLAQQAPVLIWVARLALIRGDSGSAVVALKILLPSRKRQGTAKSWRRATR